MDAEKIFVLISLNDEDKKKFTDAAVGYDLRFMDRNAITQNDINGAYAIIGSPDPKLLKDARELLWLHSQSAGVDRYVKEGVLPSGVTLTNSAGAFSQAIGEYLVGALLCIYKNFHLYRDLQREASWHPLGKVKSVFGSKVLIVGAGSIGRAFATKIKALGAYTVGVRRRHADPDECFDEMHLIDDLDALLPDFDVVAVCLPGTDETNGLFDEKRFSLMKKGSVFINIGRGNIVNQDAFAAALSDKLLGAVVDVTDVEPLPKDSPLWDAKNLLITPHVSGHMDKSDQMVRSIALENLKRFVNNEPLTNIVDVNAGY